MSEFCAKFEILVKMNDPEYMPVYLDDLTALDYNMIQGSVEENCCFPIIISSSDILAVGVYSDVDRKSHDMEQAIAELQAHYKRLQTSYMAGA